MNVFAFVAAVIAAVLFLFGGDVVGPIRRSGTSLGLFFLTLALIIQFCATRHTITF